MSSPTAPPRPAATVWTRTRDAILVGDLGLVRLRAAARALLCVPAALFVGWFLAVQLGLPPAIGMMVAVLPPFLMGFIITGDRAGRTAARSAAVIVPFLIGLGASLALQQERIIELILLIVLLFAQFYAPRFGQWAGDAAAVLFGAFLCGLLLPLPFASLGELGLIGAVSSGVAIGLTALLLRPDPRRMLRQVRRAFTVHADAVLELAAQAIAQPSPAGRDTERARRRLRARLARLHESALVADGLTTAADDDRSGRAETLHRLLFDTENAVGSIGRASGELAGSDLDLPERATIAAELRAMARGGFGEGRRAGERIVAAHGDRADVHDAVTFGVQRLVAGLAQLADVNARWRRVGSLADDGPSTPFSSPVPLANGRVLGPAKVVEEALGEASGRVRRHISAPLRTGIQAAVAVAVVEPIALALDGPRFYWAVIGVLVITAGTNSTRDRLRKTANRAIGTIAGGVVGILLVAALGTDHVGLSLVVIVVALALGMYSFSAYYAGWVAALVIVLCQVYAFAGGFDDSLVIARLGLNVLGGVAAILAGTLILPVSTVAMARAAATRQLRAVREFVDDLAEAVDDGSTRLRAAAREVDVATVQLGDVLTPLVRVRTGSRPGRDDAVRTALEAVDVLVGRIAALGPTTALDSPADAGRAREALTALSASIGELEAAYARSRPRGAGEEAGGWHRVAGRINALTSELRGQAPSSAWRRRLQAAGRIDEILAALAEREGLPVHGDAEPLAVTRSVRLPDAASS